MNDAERAPSAGRLIWLFIRWLPAVLLVTFLTGWSLVMMGGLARVFGWVMLTSVTPSFGLIIGIVVAIYAAIRRRVSRPMVVAWVLMLFVLWPGLWGLGVMPMPYPADVDDPRAQSIRVPSDETMRVYWGGNEPNDNYHVLYPDQRFAYDLVIEPAGLRTARLEDYGCYGKTVLAPIDGEVVIAQDGLPDRTPGEVVDAIPATGNHVALELPGPSYLILAHLMKDSVAVKIGDRVTEGQPLGRCGNSGRTSEPHLHLHLQVQDPRRFPLGFAEGLPLFFRDHGGARQPTGGVEVTDERIRLVGDEIRHVRTSSVPIE